MIIVIEILRNTREYVLMCKGFNETKHKYNNNLFFEAAKHKRIDSFSSTVKHVVATIIIAIGGPARGRKIFIATSTTNVLCMVMARYILVHRSIFLIGCTCESLEARFFLIFLILILFNYM
jgi:hypothetical protein